MLGPGDLVRCRYALCPGESPVRGDTLAVVSVAKHDEPCYRLTCVTFMSVGRLLSYELSDSHLDDIVGERHEHFELLASGHYEFGDANQIAGTLRAGLVKSLDGTAEVRI